MKNAGNVQIIVSMGKNSERYFVTNRVDWKLGKVIELYIRRWDMETFHRELKQGGLKHLYQRTHESLLGTAKRWHLGAFLLKISAIYSRESSLKMERYTSSDILVHDYVYAC